MNWYDRRRHDRDWGYKAVTIATVLFALLMVYLRLHRG